MGRKFRRKSGRTWTNNELKDFYMSADDRPGLEEKAEIAQRGKRSTSGREKTVTSPDMGAE